MRTRLAAGLVTGVCTVPDAVAATAGRNAAVVATAAELVSAALLPGVCEAEVRCNVCSMPDSETEQLPQVGTPSS